MLDTERLAIYDKVAFTSVKDVFMDHKRVETILLRGGVLTLGELLVRSRDELRSIRNFGTTSMLTVNAVLAEHELFIRESWRSQADAIRYTYKNTASTPAGVVMPLRFNPIPALQAQNISVLYDFRQHEPRSLARWKRSHMPYFTGDEHAQLVRTLESLRIY